MKANNDIFRRRELTYHENTSNFNLGSFVKGVSTGGLYWRLEQEKKKKEQERLQQLAIAQEIAAQKARDEAMAFADEQARLLKEQLATQIAIDKQAKALREKIHEAKIKREREKVIAELSSANTSTSSTERKGSMNKPLIIGGIVIVSLAVGFGVFKLIK